MATGSEVELIYNAHGLLAEKGIDARVVSMPSWELFEEQSPEYKESVLPKAVKARLAVEAASTFGWERYTGLDGETIGINTYGKSANFVDLFKNFGFTTKNVVEKGEEIVKKIR